MRNQHRRHLMIVAFTLSGFVLSGNFFTIFTTDLAWRPKEVSR
jgi:hypothetical protein